GVPCWMVVNIGDSRTYRLDAAGLHQISVDHSVAQKLIDSGVVSQSAPRQMPLRNMLSRAVFSDIEHSPDVWRLPIESGDRMLVCSDGLWSVVYGKYQPPGGGASPRHRSSTPAPAASRA